MKSSGQTRVVVFVEAQALVVHEHSEEQLELTFPLLSNHRKFVFFRIIEKSASICILSTTRVHSNHRKTILFNLIVGFIHFLEPPQNKLRMRFSLSSNDETARKNH